MLAIISSNGAMSFALTLLTDVYVNEDQLNRKRQNNVQNK